MFAKKSKYLNNQRYSYTRMYMNYLQRIERNIKREFPEITPEELKERLMLIKHIIALNHKKKRTSCPKEKTQ